MKTIDREVLRRLLLRWRARELGEREVHEEAEALWESAEWANYPEADDDSIALEVLSQLDILNWQLITPEDIPAMLTFLDTPPGRAEEGWERWHRYWDSVNFEKRRKELSANPYYSATPAKG